MRETWRQMRGMPPAAWVLFVGTFVNRFGTFVMPFLVFYLTRRGWSAVEAGTAIAAYGVGNVGASLCGGYLADRIGRRRTIALSMFSSAASMLALSQAESVAAVILVAALAGFTTEMYRPASSALLADLVPAEHRVTAFAIYRLAINAGFALGPATAGFLAQRSFTWLFVGDAATSVAYGIIAILLLPRIPVPPRAVRGTGEIERGAIAQMLADRRLVHFLLAAGAITVVYLQSHAGFALHCTAAGLSTANYGMLLSLNGVLIIIFELPITAWTGIKEPRLVIAAGNLLVGLGFAATGLAGTLPLLALTVAVWTLGEIVGAPVSSAYLANLAPPHLRGRYMGAFSFTWSLGLVAGPLVGSRLFAWNPAALWWTCGALGIMAALLIVTSPPLPPGVAAETTAVAS